MDIADLKNIQPPCEQVPHKLIKKAGKKAEYVSVYEINHKNLGREYKQLADKTSLEWFCSEELRTKYKLWNCKRKYKPSLYEKELERQLNSSTSQISLEINKASDFIKQNEELIEQQLRTSGIINTQQVQRALEDHTQQALRTSGIINTQQVQRALENLHNQQALSASENVNTQQVQRALPSYIEATRAALSAFNNDLSHRDILSRVHEYTSLTDKILNSNISSAETAFNMLAPHRALLETYREWETPKKLKETKKQLKREIKKKDELLEEKDKQIEALLEKQDRKLEKQSREYQNHALIWRINQAITKNLNGEKPTAIAVWNELENNYSVYDGEDGEDPIIQGINNGVVEWRSKYGRSGKFTFTSFSKILSVVRKKYSKNSN